MKTHLSYREIKFLMEKVKDDLRDNYVDVYNHKYKNGKVPRELLIENDTLEDILEKLTIAKVKCELKFKKMVKHSREVVKKKLH